MDPFSLLTTASGLLGSGGLGGILGGGTTKVTQSSSNTSNVGTSIQISNLSSAPQDQSAPTSASATATSVPSTDNGSLPSVVGGVGGVGYGDLTASASNAT